MMTWLVRVVVGLIVIGIVVFIVGSLLLRETRHTLIWDELERKPAE